MRKNKLKVCGITNHKQLLQLDEIGLDYLGFIFHHDSKRHLGEYELKKLSTPTKATKVLVTVNEESDTVKRLAEGLVTKTIQLHGEESPEVCQAYRNEGYTVFKAFGIDEGFHFESISKYVGNVDYFLFDYKGDKAGGNGIQFDWKILDFYTYDVPFFLSGGINNKHITEINELSHSNLLGIDINSGFEITPGIKNVLLIKSFSKELS